ncbi:MAG: rhodanese-related sulfurtransferase [Pseudobdellovibrionaceae bacterium]
MSEAKTHWFVTTFYKFTVLKDQNKADLEIVKTALENKAQELNIEGLLILGPDGFNTTCTSTLESSLSAWKDWMQEYFQSPGIFFKDSVSDVRPFHRFKVKLRNEIVTIGAPDLVPNLEENHHLSPEQWNQVLKEEKDFVLIDTRNWYESEIGTFKGALTPKIEQFTEFPEWVDQQQIPKDKKMLIFCTGGIRCEKGIYELQRRGYDNVWQLEGGILNYIQKHPNDQWIGECFVFDNRVAVDQNLQPSQTYMLCPHCGQPAKTKVQCQRCDTEACVCEQCLKLSWKKDTCSKNCAYQLELHPGRKGKHQVRVFENLRK